MLRSKTKSNRPAAEGTVSASTLYLGGVVVRPARGLPRRRRCGIVLAALAAHPRLRPRPRDAHELRHRCLLPRPGPVRQVEAAPIFGSRCFLDLLSLALLHAHPSWALGTCGDATLQLESGWLPWPLDCNARLVAGTTRPRCVTWSRAGWTGSSYTGACSRPTSSTSGVLTARPSTALLTSTRATQPARSRWPV